MKCVQCGNEFEGKFCPECGCAVSQNQTVKNAVTSQPSIPVDVPQQIPVQQMPIYAPPVQPRKKKLEWWKIAIGVVVALVLLVACFGNSAEGDKKPDNNTVSGSNASVDNTDEQSTESEKESVKTSKETEDNEKKASEGALGDYFIKILSCKVTKDYEKKPAIVVTYEFTNNSDDATNFLVALSSQAYQDGIELETAIIMDSKVYNSANSMKDIKPGKKIKVQQAYLLDNNKSDVEIEVSKLFSFSDEKITKTFKIK